MQERNSYYITSTHLILVTSPSSSLIASPQLIYHLKTTLPHARNLLRNRPTNHPSSNSNNHHTITQPSYHPTSLLTTHSRSPPTIIPLPNHHTIITSLTETFLPILNPSLSPWTPLSSIPNISSGNQKHYVSMCTETILLLYQKISTYFTG